MAFKEDTAPLSIFPGPVLTSEEEVRQRDGYTAPLPSRSSSSSSSTLHVPDKPTFQPNLTPAEILQAGSFGGTYFRAIKSAVTGLRHDKQWEELPRSWLRGLNVARTVSSPLYDPKVNKYGRKVGGDLHMRESSGWMAAEDPYGWLQWYSIADDERQIRRWINREGGQGEVVHCGGAPKDGC